MNQVSKSKREVKRTPLPSPAVTPERPAASYHSSESGIIRPVTLPVAPLSSIHFLVHPAMSEVQQLGQERGWFGRGYTTLSIPWVELHWTTDGWKTSHVLLSTDVPCPVVNGSFFLPNIAPGTEVEFAVHAGVACHAPHDTAGLRESGDLWFNNEGQNYRQTTR